MNIMTKRGSLDNVVTYEHYCDTKSDLNNIPKSQITLGSAAIVLKDENDSMGIYIATSQKEWIEVSTSMSGSGGGATPILNLIHICSSNEYDEETKIPTVEEPDENILYLVPNDGESNNLFNEWIYVEGEWEKIGDVSVTIPMPDWNVETYGQSGYIDNKPSIKSGTGNWSIVEGNDTVASGSSTHAEGSNTIAASNYQHVFGKYNIADNNSTYVEIVGNGDSNTRSNARTLDWNGNEWLAGNLTINGPLTLGSTTITEVQLQTLISLSSATGVGF